MSRKGDKKPKGTLQRVDSYIGMIVVSYWWYSASQKIIGIPAMDHLYLVAALRYSLDSCCTYTPSPPNEYGG